MRSMQRIALLLFFPLVLGAASVASAQSNVAIVDVGKVFKAHPSFAQKLGQLKGEAEQFQANSVQLQQQMVAKSEKLTMLTPNSEDYKAYETKLAQELAGLEVQQRNEMRGLMVREAQLHFETYQQVKTVIDQFCEAQNIRLVLRHSEQELDVDNPNSVMAKVNSNIVYHAPGRDITNDIIKQIGGVASLPGETQDR